MKLILLHNHFDPQQLESVVGDMKILGSPVIRCYDLGFDGLYQAIEGCHRIRAAVELGIGIELKVLDPSTKISDLDLDYDGDASFETISCIGDWENDGVYIDEYTGEIEESDFD